MSFADSIARVAERARTQIVNIVGEQATKMSLIAPFLTVMGYDVFDPAEVIPEYIASFAIKKAGQFEKVDYAIKVNDKIVMIIEAKAHDQKAEAHDGQLGRYFNSLVHTKVAIVSNGIQYRFFTDLKHENVMDERPFFTFDLLNYQPKDLEDLKIFHRDNFDAIGIKQAAEEMVYLKGMTNLLANVLQAPSDEFIKFLIGEMSKSSESYEIGQKITAKVIGKFRPIVQKALKNSLVHLMTRSIDDALGTPIPVTPDTSESVSASEEVEEETATVIPGIETTEEELAAFDKIQAIAASSSQSDLPVTYKDVMTYFGVNVGKPAWWFARLYLSAKQKSIIFRLSPEEVQLLAAQFKVQEAVASGNDGATKVLIDSIDDLDQLKPLILRAYETEASKH